MAGRLEDRLANMRQPGIYETSINVDWAGYGDKWTIAAELVVRREETIAGEVHHATRRALGLRRSRHLSLTMQLPPDLPLEEMVFYAPGKFMRPRCFETARTMLALVRDADLVRRNTGRMLAGHDPIENRQVC